MGPVTCIGVGSAAATHMHLGGDVKNRWLDCVWAWARLAGVVWVGGDAKKGGHSIFRSCSKRQFPKYVSITYSRARWRYGVDRNGFSAKVSVFHLRCHLNSHLINPCCFGNPVGLALMLPHVKSMPLPNLGWARRAVSNLGCPQ